MLASRAHVKIGTYEYMLDEGVENHYDHRFEYGSPEEAEIAGDPGARTLRKNKLFWSITDWTGGEGNAVWYKDDPSTYDYGDTLNPRIPGQITGRPKRFSRTLAAGTDDGDRRVYLEAARGMVWLCGGERAYYSADFGNSWTLATGTGLTAGDKITATAGDETWLYVAQGISTHLEVRRIKDDANIAGTSDAVIVRRSAADGDNFNRYIGMTIMGGRLYGWTGGKLWEIDIKEGASLDIDDEYRKVGDTGANLDYDEYGGGAPGAWFGDVTSSENSVIAFQASDGITHVYEFKGGGFREMWRLPYGFTGKGIVVQNSVVYISGYYVGVSGQTSVEAYGALYAMPLKTKEEVFVGWFRKNQMETMHMREAANSYGYQIMVAGANRGRVMIYDAEFDGISMLDDYDAGRYPPEGWDSTNSKIGDMLTFGIRRFVAFYEPGTAAADDWHVQMYEVDEPSLRSVAGAISNSDVASIDLEDTWTSGNYDFGFPMDPKSISGFYVTFKVEEPSAVTSPSGLLVNQRITVEYSLDGAAFVTAGTISSATTPDVCRGRKFITVTGSPKFINAKIRVTLDNNGSTTVQQPILYSVTMEAEQQARNEYWELVLRVKDEPNTNARPLNRKYSGSKIRDYLEDLMTNKTAVTFLDGYRYRGRKEYTTHDVIIEEWQDRITKLGEGSCRVLLRKTGDA